MLGRALLRGAGLRSARMQYEPEGFMVEAVICCMRINRLPALYQVAWAATPEQFGETQRICIIRPTVEFQA